MDRDRITSATFEEIWAEVIDPLYLEAASSPSAAPSHADVVLDVLALWMLHSVAARSGLASLVAEEPPWMAARTVAAAGHLGLDDVASLWERATRGLDLAKSAGRVPARIRFTDQDARRELEDLLVRGRHAELNRWLVERIREQADAFTR